MNRKSAGRWASIAATVALPLLGSWCAAPAAAAPPASHGRNYVEARVRPYVLPDPLLGKDGRRARDADDWQSWRRGEILKDFRDLMYGHTPEIPFTVRPEVVATRRDAVGGLATRTQVTLHLFDDESAPKIHLLLYVPNAATEPVPAFLGLSFYGNASIVSDPAIQLSPGWMRPHRTPGVVVDNRATEKLRGIAQSRWPLDTILKRGYAVATFYAGDVEPDHIDGWRDGIRGYALRLSGQSERAVDAWGALGTWGWGLSRALDYLQAHPDVDGKRVAVFGHSRFGKTSLWTGAQDQRFALVISNDSGEGGASLARRNFGENIAYSIYHASWRYCRRFGEYIDREDELPFDQHMLIALMAPRPVYVASATEDGLADPKGEFLSVQHAEPVYRLFGLVGVNTTQWPEPDRPVGETVRYHVRTGGHDVTDYDWQQYLDFADRHLTSEE